MQLYDRGNVHNECMQSTMPTTIRRNQESTIGCLSASVNTVHSGGQPYTTLHVGCDSVPMKFKVDTGAQINVIPITAFDTLAESRMKQLKPTQVRLPGYSGNVVPTTGTCRIECKLRDKPHTLEFFLIADTHATPILGFDSCRAMGLVTIENRLLKMSHTEVAAVKTVDLPPTIPKDIAEEYSELFRRSGTISTYPHDANETRGATRGTRAKACTFRLA